MSSRKKLQAVNQTPQFEPIAATIPQAAQMLGSTIRGVRELIWSKRLAHVKVGKRFLIPVEELRAFLRREAVRP